MFEDKIKKFGRIGVLMGGPSSEREISLRSGKAVYDLLTGAGYDAVAIDAVGDVAGKVVASGVKIAFIALHGKFGEDGTVQTILEELGIAYPGSGPLASRLALDKISSRRIFESAGIRVPAYKVLSADGCAPVNMKFPVVVKPASSGSSIGLSVVNSSQRIADALSLAFQYDDWVVIEEYVDGREVTVGILNNEPLPVVEIIPKEKLFDYRAKYTAGLTEYVVPAQLERSVYSACQSAGLLAHESLGCRSFSRVDMLIDRRDGAPVVLEVNTIPGLTATSLLPKAAKAIGIDFLELCERIIISAIGCDVHTAKAQQAPKEVRI